MEKEKIALLESIYRTILQIRILGYKGQQEGLSKKECELIADLADAIHNIPEAIAKDKIDLDFQVDIMLKGFEEKYNASEVTSPYKCYKASLEGEGSFQ